MTSDGMAKSETDMREDGVFERVIRADERAQEAHRRLDRHDDAFAQVGGRIAGIEVAVNALSIQVAKLNTKVAVAAGLGSLIGGGAIAVLVAVLQPG